MRPEDLGERTADCFIPTADGAISSPVGCRRQFLNFGAVLSPSVDLAPQVVLSNENTDRGPESADPNAFLSTPLSKRRAVTRLV
jgi:hypothetical protein